MKPMPSTAVKQANRQAIIDHLYRHGPSTKQHLQMTLGLSLPTITANLRDLEDEDWSDEASRRNRPADARRRPTCSPRNRMRRSA